MAILRKFRSAVWLAVALFTLLKAKARTRAGESRTGRGSPGDDGEGGWQLAGADLGGAVKALRSDLKKRLPAMLRFPNGPQTRSGSRGGSRKGKRGNGTAGGGVAAARGAVAGQSDGKGGSVPAVLGTGQVAARARADFGRIGKRVAAVLQVKRARAERKRPRAPFLHHPNLHPPRAAAAAARVVCAAHSACACLGSTTEAGRGTLACSLNM
jgi:hypothetical protein